LYQIDQTGLLRTSLYGNVQRSVILIPVLLLQEFPSDKIKSEN